MPLRFDSRLLRIAKERKVDLPLNYNAAEVFVEIAKKVLTNEIESATIRGESEEMSKVPDYAVSQADLNGYKRGLRHALKLLETQGT